MNILYDLKTAKRLLTNAETCIKSKESLAAKEALMQLEIVVRNARIALEPKHGRNSNG